MVCEACQCCVLCANLNRPSLSMLNTFPPSGLFRCKPFEFLLVRILARVDSFPCWRDIVAVNARDGAEKCGLDRRPVYTSMYMRMYVFIYVCMFSYTHICAHMYIYIDVFIQSHLYMDGVGTHDTYLYKHASKQTNKQARKQTYIREHIHTYVHTYMSGLRPVIYASSPTAS